MNNSQDTKNSQLEQERCVGCEACIDTACGRDECPKGWPKALQQEQEPVAWVPYLSDRADGVKGHYAIARWNPRGYREVWNLRRHEWGAYSDDVLSLEEADTLLRLITIPTRKVTSPQPPQPKEPEQEPVAYLVTGPYEKVAFSDIGSANAYCKGLNTGYGTEAYLVVPLYTTPPQRTWVGLTDDERRQAMNTVTYSQLGMTAAEWAYEVQKATEAKLKEKNT